MIQFNNDYLLNFLAVVRKYMQLRGGYSQKDLADKMNVGVSTMSRFLNQKTKDLDPQMIAQIIAVLNIPLHEVIDFVMEDSTQAFKKLIQFYKEQTSPEKELESKPDLAQNSFVQNQEGWNEEIVSEVLGEQESRLKTSANIRGVNVPFGEKPLEKAAEGKVQTFKDKINRLSPRQKGFLTDFLDLDGEGRDLIVDLGNSLFRYFKQKNAEF
jgi:transcriptional regulator with XRE-family HTH domain